MAREIHGVKNRMVIDGILHFLGDLRLVRIEEVVRLICNVRSPADVAGHFRELA